MLAELRSRLDGASAQRLPDPRSGSGARVYVQKRGDVTLADIGVVQQRELFEREADRLGARRRSSKAPTCCRSAAALARLCAALGIVYTTRC